MLSLHRDFSIALSGFVKKQVIELLTRHYIQELNLFFSVAFGSSASTDSWVSFRQIVGSVLSVPGDMGDQEIAYDNADWSEDSNMDECDPGAPLTDQASSDRNPDYTHADFAYKLKVQILPNDQENCGEFDVGVDFRIGDPNVHFRAAAAKSCETIEHVGKPDLLFGHILARMSHLRFLSTVYVLVDNRDLTNLDNPDPSSQQASGFHMVHHTWARHLRPGSPLPGLSWSTHRAP